MLDLAISNGSGLGNRTVVETNNGVELKALGWPQDCDFQIVAFDPEGEDCEVVGADGLAEDIGKALACLDGASVLEGPKPAWYRRLERCARGSHSAQ
jgi:hypothetical protein